jgi:hypothetical protein
VKNIKKRKGEITTQQIVLLIILLVSFIVILFLLFRLNLGKQSDSEICHNSVAMRGNPISKEAIPIKCARSYICITKDGNCEGMTKPQVKKVNTAEELYDVLAEEMSNCWWMFGEGKVNYVTDTMTKDNYCSICNQILFDNSLKDIKDKSGNAVFSSGKISKDALYDYLSKTKTSNNITYAQYFFGTSNVNKLKEELSKQTKGPVSFGTITIGKQYFVVTGITSEINTLGWVIRGAAAGGALIIGLATFGVGTATMTAILVADTAGGVAGVGGSKISDMISPKIGAITVEGDGVKNKFMIPTIQEASSEEFKALNCDEILTST